MMFATIFIQAQLTATDNRFFYDGGNLRGGSRSPAQALKTKNLAGARFSAGLLRLVTAKHTALHQHLKYMSNPQQAQILGIFMHFEYGTLRLFSPEITV
ncbi:hypothetical protein [Vagococcus sp. WN89Y]|uniref:hypothetical protein n=1 Tax=Vagococcus sp. WN89Y TaxID=3457258 RepID=UPI003FCE3979